MSNRTVIYARYSSNLQSERSIDDQVRLCKERADNEGLIVTETYTDYAISGGTLSNRPGMLALMDEAKKGEIDIVLAESLDRISRDQEDIAAIFKRLTHFDTKIITQTEGEINELHVGLKGTMNALFLKDLAIKTRRGQRGRVEAGKIPGGNSYGYIVVRCILPDGSVSTGERKINPEQANTVCRIFSMYINGIAPRKIAAALNAEGIGSPRGGQWNASTINGSRQRRNGILNNELYTGTITYNRQRFVKDPDTGKRTSRLNPEHEWVKTKVPELRIIDDDVWNRAQAIKAQYSSRKGNKRQTKKRLLTGLVKCGHCGGAMTIVNRGRYYCSNKRERGTCSSSAGIKADLLEARVLNGLRDILVGREELIDVFVREYNATIKQQRKKQCGHRAQVQKALNTVNNSIQRCIAFITDGDGAPGIVRGELQELEQRKGRLEAELNTQKKDTIVTPMPNLAESYAKKICELQSLLTDEGARPQVIDIVRSFVDRIDIRAGAKRGEPEVILTGALASILSFMCRQKNTAVSYENGGRVLMVAGARNHLSLLCSPPVRGG